ncbi:hypothetical protein TRVL_06957 [Trypanosoma vivax]|nr:hypothetical protein TRVL_06957 [Trypanosoma vivax]
MGLSAGRAVVEDAILRRIWDLILCIVRLRATVNFQFVFSHCGVPRNEAADKAAEQGNAKPQSYPAWITDIVTGVVRQVRNVMYRTFGEGRMPRTAVRCSATLGQHQSTPSWIVWANRYWRSSEQADRSISGGYTECSHARRAGLSADGAARRPHRGTKERSTRWRSQQRTVREHQELG